ncbi:hypothetical protein [Kitasatospora sp. KL5]|uniref:hypothetical protein n=1 Tax=Kitasatospora sp. KL5 TaxID=3425125 RepID=UPI003D6FAC8C
MNHPPVRPSRWSRPSTRCSWATTRWGRAELHPDGWAAVLYGHYLVDPATGTGARFHSLDEATAAVTRELGRPTRRPAGQA